MVERRDTDDRLQRLADLSIEIRMLKARVQASIEQHTLGVSSPRVEDTKPLPSTQASVASCPHCGHPAGLALLPREYRQSSTLVRCFGCQRDSSAVDWVVGAPGAIALDASPRPAGAHLPR